VLGTLHAISGCFGKPHVADETDLRPSPVLSTLHGACHQCTAVLASHMWLTKLTISSPILAGVLHPGAPLLVQVFRAAGIHRRHGAAGWAPPHLIVKTPPHPRVSVNPPALGSSDVRQVRENGVNGRVCRGI
jgi:hypothetical protein